MQTLRVHVPCLDFLKFILTFGSFLLLVYKFFFKNIYSVEGIKVDSGKANQVGKYLLTIYRPVVIEIEKIIKYSFTYHLGAYNLLKKYKLEHNNLHLFFHSTIQQIFIEELIEFKICV